MPGEDFVGMTLRYDGGRPVNRPAFCNIYTREHFAAFSL